MRYNSIQLKDQSQKNASTKNADEIKEPEPEKTSDNGEAMPTKRTKLVTCHLCLSIFAAVSGTGFVFGFNTGVLNNPMVIKQSIGFLDDFK